MMFSSMTSLTHLAVVGTASYVAILILLRVSGARTLSKLHAFDFVVTIALGDSQQRIRRPAADRSRCARDRREDQHHHLGSAEALRRVPEWPTTQ